MLLFINSIAGSEIIIILLFVLIFFGAKSIPGMARGLGKGIRQIKDASQDVQDEIRKTSTEMKREMNINRAIHEAKNTIEAPVKSFKEDIEKSAIGVSKSIDGEGESNTGETPVHTPVKISEKNKEESDIKPDQQNNI